MFALLPGVRVYVACDVTITRKGMIGLAMLVQQALDANPLDGALYAFRGRRAGTIELILHDDVGLCILINRLERGCRRDAYYGAIARSGLHSAEF